MGAVASPTAASTAQLAIRDGPPPCDTGTLPVWEGAAAAGALLQEASLFVRLNFALGDYWHPVAVNRSRREGRFSPMVQGYPLTRANRRDLQCRFLMQQPKVGDPSRIYFRAASGQDTRMGYLLFVHNLLCERANMSGTAGPWERLELRPTRFGEPHCFHIWSHQSQLPVCFAKGGAPGFERRRPQQYSEMVVFSLVDPEATVVSEVTSLATGASSASVTELLPRGISGTVADSAFSAALYATTLPRRVLQSSVQTLFVGLPSLTMRFMSTSLLGATGRSSSASLGRGSGCTSSVLGRSSAASQRLSIDATDAHAVARIRSQAARSSEAGRASSASAASPASAKPALSAFELLGARAQDAESGEVLPTDQVIRGSRRIETVRFQANQDLHDVVRVTRVSFACIVNTTTRQPMGTFLGRAEPHEHIFPEQHVPMHAPPGTYKIELSYVAANIQGDLFVERTKFKMV